MGMGIREYARHRGVGHSTVQKALQTGRIQKEPDGTIDPVKADADWESNTDQAMQRTHVSEPPTPTFIPPDPLPKPAPRSTANATAEPEAGPSGPLVPNYQANRAIREAYAARTAKLDYEERMGTLLKKADVEADAFACNRRTRDRIQSIPSRVASVLSSMTDALAIERLLDKELYDALEELSR